MAAGLWILPVLLFSGAPAPAIPAGCEKACEKRYVPCSDGRAESQMMCFEVVRRCELRCEKPQLAGAKKQRPPRAQGRRK